MQPFYSKCASEDDCSIGNECLFDCEIMIFGFQLFLVLNILEVIEVIEVTCPEPFFVSWSIHNIIEIHNCLL
jgi:hypothetical protein